MLGKHILGYLPSLLVPAITAFAAIYFYTRLLSPDEYGHYALALNAMTMLSAVFFYWLHVSIPRLMPQAVKENRAAPLRTTSYIAFAAAAAVLILCACIFIGLVPLGDLAGVAWLAVPLAIIRSLLTLNQAFHRSALNFRRYNVIECGQALLGLALGLTLVWKFGCAGTGAILGLLVGMAVMTLVDQRILLAISPRQFSRAALVEIARFGLPIMAIYSLNFVLSASDRFFIEHFRGASEVGLYATGYSLMDRVGQIVFMMVATPAFPLVVHKLEHEGVEAARAQTYHNGVALLALGVPACAGLMLCNTQLAAVLIGPQFREGALAIMPFIAASTLLNGLSTHYFDHAFYLAKKSERLLLTQGPAAALNVALNLLWIPQYGYAGAAWAALASYALLLTLSISLGRRVFRIHFPFKPALQIAASTAAMATILHFVHSPPTAGGLAAMVILGTAAYSLGLLAFDVMGLRRSISLLLK